MDTKSAHPKFARVVGTALVGLAAPALLLLAPGAAHAIPDVADRGGVAIIDNLPTPRDCGSCRVLDPQPEPPGLPDPGSRGFNPQPDPPSAQATARR